MPPTTARNIRIPDDEWERAKSKAAERGETITDVVRRALREYVREEDGRVWTVTAEPCVCHEGGGCPVHRREYVEEGT